MLRGKALIVDPSRHCYRVRVWQERPAFPHLEEETVVPWSGRHGESEDAVLAILHAPRLRGVPEASIPRYLVGPHEAQVPIRDLAEPAAPLAA